MSVLIEEVRAARKLPPPSMARAIRLAADVSQERIAAELGVHRVTIARWEMGTRRPRGQLRIAYADLLQQLQETTS
jgi:transcriptional regulator with XRE-family HTH domain